MNALKAEAITVRYGGVLAVAEVDITLSAGTLTGLIGPNGAGKTSFIDALTGFTASEGRVLLGNTDISSDRPDQRARAGLMRTWQSADLFNDLTVRENLSVTAHRPSLRDTMVEFLTHRRAEQPGVDHALQLLGIEGLADRFPDELTEGQRKLVAVARSLAPEPSVLCLDEPAAGLDAGESQELGRRLRRIVDDGPAVLMIDHDMELVMSVCDEVVVIDFGRVIATGTPEEIRVNPTVLEAYLGSSASEVVEAVEDAAAATAGGER